MSSNKSLAFALCLAVTGCAQSPQNDSAEGGHWWSFGSDKVAQSGPDKAAAPKADVKAVASAPAAQADSATHWWWPFASGAAPAPTASVAPKPDVAAAKAGAQANAAPVVAKADSASHWWWPFEGKKDEAKLVPIPMPDPKITQAWLDDYEPRLRLAIKDSPFELERRENVLVITAPADSSFNPKRPTMLLPVTLGPITRLAKAIESDPKTSVLVLGHVDTAGAGPESEKLSQDRAQSVASIFRLSGLERDRLNLRGMGSLMPRAANDSVEGRSLNRRVEIFMTPQNTMLALLSKYNMPAPAATRIAVKTVQPTPVALVANADVPAKKAVPVKKASTAKKAPVKKTAKAAPAKAKAKAVAPVKKTQPTDQAKAN